MRIRKYLPVILLLLLLFWSGGADLLAQCPMCRATAESNLANGGTEGQGLNKGILYLFFTPYLIIGTLAFFWWRNRVKNREEEPESPVL
jgi:hypothetical protein